MKILLLLLLLSGCAVAQQTPTLQHCDYVNYVREGLSIRIEMRCTVPIAAPIPLPKVL
jgi:hypothetical protein